MQKLLFWEILEQTLPMEIAVRAPMTERQDLDVLNIDGDIKQKAGRLVEPRNRNGAQRGQNIVTRCHGSGRA
jgi:hypothetical protein